VIPSLCEFCRHMHEVVSGKGSHFLLCQKSDADNRYRKYPPLPVIQCRGFERNEDHNHEAPRYGVEIKVPHE
jgi:hypothetical protein